MTKLPGRLGELDSREFFVFGVRISFGLWLTYVGVMKWVDGASGFAGYIGGEFANAWPPELMIVGLTWFILIAEPLFGILLLVGKCQRMVWTLVALLMFTLMFGKTILGDHATVANNWQYLVLAIACAAMSKE